MVSTNDGSNWWALGPSGLGFKSSVPPMVTIPFKLRDPTYPNRQPKPPNLPLAYKQVWAKPSCFACFTCFMSFYSGKQGKHTDRQVVLSVLLKKLLWKWGVSIPSTSETDEFDNSGVIIATSGETSPKTVGLAGVLAAWDGIKINTPPESSFS